MAARSKTKVGGQRGSEAANRARRGQSEAISRQTDREERKTAQMRQNQSRGFAQAGATLQRQKEMEDAAKQREAEGEAGRAQQQTLQDERIAAQQQEGQANRDVQSRSQDLRAAQSGLQPAGDQQGMGPEEQGPPVSPDMQRRQEELQAEMDRGEQQAQKPGELDTQRFVPTEESKRQQGVKEDQAQQALSLQGDRAEAMRVNALRSARAASLKGDLEAKKAAKETYGSHIRKLGDRADRILKSQMTGAPSSLDDINYLKRLAGDNPDPALQEELSSGKLGSASARFLRGRQIYDGLEYVAETGEWADQDSIDEAHPMYQEFQRHVVDAGSLLKQRQAVGGLAGISSLVDANRLKRRIAAKTMREMATRRGQRAAMGVGGSQPPPSAPAAPGAQQNVQPGSPGSPGATEPAGPYMVTRPQQPSLELPQPELPGGR